MVAILGIVCGYASVRGNIRRNTIVGRNFPDAPFTELSEYEKTFAETIEFINKKSKGVTNPGFNITDKSEFSEELL